jgi:hypothetical protein
MKSISGPAGWALGALLLLASGAAVAAIAPEFDRLIQLRSILGDQAITGLLHWHGPIDAIEAVEGVRPAAYRLRAGACVLQVDLVYDRPPPGPPVLGGGGIDFTLRPGSVRCAPPPRGRATLPDLPPGAAAERLRHLLAVLGDRQTTGLLHRHGLIDAVEALGPGVYRLRAGACALEVRVMANGNDLSLRPAEARCAAPPPGGGRANAR